MKFLIDNNLSLVLADALKAARYDAVHLRDLGMQAATDHIVLEHARADERILVSADTDFGGLLARSGARRLLNWAASDRHSHVVTRAARVMFGRPAEPGG